MFFGVVGLHFQDSWLLEELLQYNGNGMRG